MEDLYGAAVPAALSALATQAAQLAAMGRKGVLEPFWASVRTSPVAAWVDCGPWLPGGTHGGRDGLPLLFWREALAHVCHQLGAGLVRERPLLALLERLERGGPRLDGFIALKKENRTLLCGTTLVIFRSSFLGPNDDDQASPPPAAGEQVVVALPARRVGAWVVRASRGGEEDAGALLREGAEAAAAGGGSDEGISRPGELVELPPTLSPRVGGGQQQHNADEAASRAASRSKRINRQDREIAEEAELMYPGMLTGGRAQAAPATAEPKRSLPPSLAMLLAGRVEYAVEVPAGLQHLNVSDAAEFRKSMPRHKLPRELRGLPQGLLETLPLLVPAERVHEVGPVEVVKIVATIAG